MVGSNVQVYDATGEVRVSDHSIAGGAYTISGLLTGNYFVKANPPGPDRHLDARVPALQRTRLS